MSNKLFLYDHPVSSYAQKVRMALRFKGLDFEKQTPQNLGAGNPDEAFSDANVRMEVPALIDGDFKIFDSTAIMMYLEEKFPSPTMLPSAPEARATTRMIEEICDTHYEAINWAIGEIKWFKRAEGAEAERLLAAAKHQTKQIQNWLATKLGSQPFFNGDNPGYADFAVAPIVNRSVLYELELEEQLKSWHARVNEVPAVKETYEEMLQGAVMMSKAGPTVFAPHGGRRREYRDHRLEWMIKNGAMNIVEKGLTDDNIRFSWPHPDKS